VSGHHKGQWLPGGWDAVAHWGSHGMEGQQGRTSPARAHPTIPSEKAGQAEGGAPIPGHLAPPWDWGRRLACG